MSQSRVVHQNATVAGAPFIARTRPNLPGGGGSPLSYTSLKEEMLSPNGRANDSQESPCLVPHDRVKLS